MMETLELPKADPEKDERRPYSIEHSLITHLIDEGTDSVLVREYVGHSHAHGAGKALTAVQSRYKARQTERLRELVPGIEKLLEVNVPIQDR